MITDADTQSLQQSGISRVAMEEPAAGVPSSFEADWDFEAGGRVHLVQRLAFIYKSEFRYPSHNLSTPYPVDFPFHATGSELHCKPSARPCLH